MASSSNRLFLLKAAILLQSLALSVASTASTEPTKFMDAVCNHVHDKSFCLKTLIAYPSALPASDLIPVAYAAIGLGISHAEKTIGFINETVKNEPVLKSAFEKCREAYRGIVSQFQMAARELEDSPLVANYDIELSRDQTVLVEETLGNAGDEASKTLMERTRQMDSYISLASGATNAIVDAH